MHRRAFFKQNFDREYLSRGIMVCRFCHNAIHRLYDEMTLAKQFASLELLLADEAVQRHIQWVIKKR
jgi:hypothetical protein